MTQEAQVDKHGLSAELLDQVKRFESDYNKVDAHIRRALGSDQRKSFTDCVHEYAKRHVGWRERDFLLEVAALRNAIVHGRTEPDRYVAIPIPTVVQRLERCWKQLSKPELVLPRLKQTVAVLSASDTLMHALALSKQNNFSQFPVYEGDRFRGLLTENGITRWLAEHVTTQLSLVDFESVEVRKVLRKEEKRPNYMFLPRQALLINIPTLFASNAELEAVFITETGKESEKLLGVATAWDCLQIGVG